MQQTAVKWLIEQVKSKEWQDMFIWHKEEVFKQAKEIEKEQIEKAYEQGEEDGYYHPELGYGNKYDSAEKYYTETYKSE